MKTPLTVAALVAVLALATQAQAASSSVLLGDAGWNAFATTSNIASFAWAGENETFTDNSNLTGTLKQAVTIEEGPINVELLTGVAAPEPPALVLAGMAFGGVLCGRSLLMRRRKGTAPAESSEA